MKTVVLLLAVALLAPPPAAAQVELGAGMGPDILLSNEKKKTEPTLVPLGLATSLVFDTTTWVAVGASTAPVQELSDLLRRGYYKFELIELVLVAQRGSTPLKELVKARDKGKALRELAVERSVDFDAVYEDALALDARLTGRILPSVMRVAVSTAPASVESPRKEKRR